MDKMPCAAKGTKTSRPRIDVSFGPVKSLAFTAVITLIFFSATEVLLRILIPYSIESSQQTLQFHVPELGSAGYDYDRFRFWKLKTNFTGQISANHPWTVSTNSHGMRSPETAIQKESGVFRIITIGDSSTFGWGIQESMTYSRQLEALLKHNTEGRRFEVVNAGVPGYSSYQGLQYLERELLVYEPDLVLAYFGLNDFTGARFYSDKEQRFYESTPNSTFLNFIRGLRVYHVMHRVVSKLLPRDRFDSYFRSETNLRVSPEDYRINLDRMKELAKENGFRIFFLTPVWNRSDGVFYNYPFWFADDIDVLGDIGPIIDTYSGLKQREAMPSLIFMDTAHPTGLGHRIIAETVFSCLSGELMLAE